MIASHSLWPTPTFTGIRTSKANHSVEERVRLAIAGDADAFAELWERYSPTAHAILLGMVSDHEADDLMQEVGLAAWNAVARLEQPDRFAAWLCTIARNLGRDALRRRPRPTVDVEQAEGARTAPPASTSAEANEVLARIRSLPECYSEPLLLRLVLGMSGPEIAAQLGMTKGSVRVNLHRGMKMLRESLQDGME